MWIVCKVSSDPKCRITLCIEVTIPLSEDLPHNYLENDYRSANSSRSLYLFLSLSNVLRYSLLFSIMRYRNLYSCILSRYNYWIENAWWFPIQYYIPALLWDSCHDVLVFSYMVLFIYTKESKWSECKEMHSLRSKLCSVLVLSTGSMTSWCDGPLEI